MRSRSPDDGVDYLAACDEPLAGRAVVCRSGSPGLLISASRLSSRRRGRSRETAARAFSEIGLASTEASPDLGDPSVILKALYGGAQAGAHAARSPEQKAQMDPELVRYAEASAGLSVVDYLRAVGARQALTDALRRFFERYDLLLTPTLCAAGLPARPRRPPRDGRARGDAPRLDALLPVQLQRPAGCLRPGRLDGQRPARRAADRRPAPEDALVLRGGGLRGAAAVGVIGAPPELRGDLTAWPADGSAWRSRPPRRRGL